MDSSSQNERSQTVGTFQAVPCEKTAYVKREFFIKYVTKRQKDKIMNEFMMDIFYKLDSFIKKFKNK